MTPVAIVIHYNLFTLTGVAMDLTVRSVSVERHSEKKEVTHECTSNNISSVDSRSSSVLRNKT